MRDTLTAHITFSNTIGWLKLLRPKQWIKNVFVLAPLLFSAQFLNLAAIGSALFAALLFCLASGATYVINDIQDIHHDRLHPVKSKTRPLASGRVSLLSAFVLLGVLYILLLWGWLADLQVGMIIATYVALNLAYTFFLKHQPVLDIFTVAMGFVLRVYAGAVAIHVPVSSWMFITTLCLALYLAAIKRRQELSHNGAGSRQVLQRYSIALVDRYAEIAAVGTLLFYSLFILSMRTQLIITIPLVLFGLFRYWYLVEALKEGESPTEALLKDTQLLVTLTLWVIACMFGLWPGHP